MRMRLASPSAIMSATTVVVSGTLALVLVAGCGTSRPASTESPTETASPPNPTATTTDAGVLVTTATDGGSPEVTLTVVQSTFAKLQQTLSTAASAYGQVDLVDINDLLTDTLLRASTPGGNGTTTAACLARAKLNDGFTVAQSTALCANGTTSNADCAVRAFQALGFDRDQAVALCSARGATVEAADCGVFVFDLGFSRADAVSVCAGRDGATVTQCVSAASRAFGFDNASTVSLCRNRGLSATATCASRANASFGFSRAQAVELCAGRGVPETADCAAQAVALAFSQDQAVALCSLRGTPANATCARDSFPTVTPSRDATVAACRTVSAEVEIR
jgi:hypothetical protein